MKNFACFLVVFLFLLCPAAALAIPSLGVAPSTSNPGVYYGITGDGSSAEAGVEWLDEYQQYFVTGSAPIPADFDSDGFSMLASGDDLTVWWGFNEGFPNETLYLRDVWLFTDSPLGPTFTLDGSPFLPVTSTQIDGYNNPPEYWGINLGSVMIDSTPNPDWERVLEAPFIDGAYREFYFYTGTLEYDEENFRYGEDWFFAVVGDIIEFSVPTVINVDYFSPKTTSSSYDHAPVPEPATMLLLGSGLIGLAGFGRKRFVKR